MTKKEYAVPLEIQMQLMERVKAFNKKYLSNSECKYMPYIKGKFIYLMRDLCNGTYDNVCRLTYSGDLENMAFAIYKYSTEKYDPNEMFPGDQYVDGTLEGAMKAGKEAYF